LPDEALIRLGGTDFLRVDKKEDFETPLRAECSLAVFAAQEDISTTALFLPEFCFGSV
jgi:hypothetical protein